MCQTHVIMWAIRYVNEVLRMILPTADPEGKHMFKVSLAGLQKHLRQSFCLADRYPKNVFLGEYTWGYE